MHEDRVEGRFDGDGFVQDGVHLVVKWIQIRDVERLWNRL